MRTNHEQETTGTRWSRPALGLAILLFVLALPQNALEVPAVETYPAGLYESLDHHAELTYARARRFVNDLRLFFELRSRLEELESRASPSTHSPGKASTRLDDGAD